MRGLAFFRDWLGAFAWFAPRLMNRVFGVPRADDSPAFIYMDAITGGATAIDIAALGESDEEEPKSA